MAYVYYFLPFIVGKDVRYIKPFIRIQVSFYIDKIELHIDKIIWYVSVFDCNVV